jgi:hypothetical protein
MLNVAVPRYACSERVSCPALANAKPLVRLFKAVDLTSQGTTPRSAPSLRHVIISFLAANPLRASEEVEVHFVPSALRLLSMDCRAFCATVLVHQDDRHASNMGVRRLGQRLAPPYQIPLRHSNRISMERLDFRDAVTSFGPLMYGPWRDPISRHLSRRRRRYRQVSLVRRLVNRRAHGCLLPRAFWRTK